jgi:cholesterol transport system auxiliary component
MLNKTISRKFSRQATIKTNPKSEYRNPKQTGSQINPKLEKIQNLQSESDLFGNLRFWSFEFVSNFGFRASKFCAWRPLRLCARHSCSELFFSKDSKYIWLVFQHGLLALLALCAACVGIERSYPDKRYFVLEVPAQAVPSNPTVNETLEVSNIRVSPRYADRSFVYRTSEAGYETDFYNQFLVAPASLITEEVRKGLLETQIFKHVIGSASQSQPNYVLEGAVNALYGDFRNVEAPRAVLEMEFFLTSEIPAKPGILMQKRYAKSIPLTGRSPEALVKGWNQALEEILTSLTADLKAAGLKGSK